MTTNRTGHFRVGDHYRYYESGLQMCPSCRTTHDRPRTLCPACSPREDGGYWVEEY